MTPLPLFDFAGGDAMDQGRESRPLEAVPSGETEVMPQPRELRDTGPGDRVITPGPSMDRRKRRGVEGHAAQRGKGEGAAGYACKLFTPPWWMREKAHVVEPRELRSHCSRDLLGKRKHPAGIKPGRRFLGSVAPYISGEGTPANAPALGPVY